MKYYKYRLAVHCIAVLIYSVELYDKFIFIKKAEDDKDIALLYKKMLETRNHQVMITSQVEQVKRINFGFI